jgi:glycerophosphoryl diester phosphodiesterase
MVPTPHTIVTGQLPPKLEPFLRPIAHRGLHGVAEARPENTLAAINAAVTADLAVECDVQRTADDRAVIFHDETLTRLCGTPDRIDALTEADVCGQAVLGGPHTVPTVADALSAIAAAVPLVIEIKPQPHGTSNAWLTSLLSDCAAYPGALAFKSFDPEILATLRQRGCHQPLGIVCRDLASVTPLALASAEFISVHIGVLTEILRGARADELRPPALMTWTVRTETELHVALSNGISPVFEGLTAEQVKTAWAALN